MKSIAFSLSLIMIFSSVSAFAQAPEAPKVISCSTRIKAILGDEDSVSSNETAAGFGVAAFPGIVIGTLIGKRSGADDATGTKGAVMGAGVVLLVGGAVVGTMVAIKKHRENILSIFKGAATGGNSKTEKLWKIANRKNKHAFKDITYAEFLDKVHEADISGSACESENVPERKDIIKILVKDYELVEEFIGEKPSPKAGRDVSGRGVRAEKPSRSETPTPESPAVPDAKEF